MNLQNNINGENDQEDFDRILSVGEECIEPEGLRRLLRSKGLRGSQQQHTSSSSHGDDGVLRFYDGFEPSGRMHIAQGLFKAICVNKCIQHGTSNSNATFIFWIADWFALMNDKMGGDPHKIRIVGEYLQEVWKAVGMDLRHVDFKWASQEITKHAATYWPCMLDIARRFSISRVKRCCQIMGRTDNNLTAAQILYPIMQCADVFHLKADVCQLGTDQKKVNVLALEILHPASKRRQRGPRRRRPRMARKTGNLIASHVARVA